MNKKRYIKPDFQIIKLDEHDQIATSMRMSENEPLFQEGYHVYGQW